MKAQRKKVSIGTSISYLYLVILSIIAAFPLLWILLSSVKSKGEITGNPTSFFPKEITFDYYKIVLGQLSFTTNIGNSLFIAGVTTLLTIIIASLGAYGVVRFFTKFGKAMTRVLITTYMFPPILLAVPYSIIMGKSGLMNTRLGLIIVYLSFSVPYAIWLLVGFFQTVPLEIEEAGRIDGANKLTIFLKIVVPIVSPGIVAVAIYTFINAWNEFLYSLILLNDNSKMTVSVALKSLEGQEVLDWGTLMAASALVVVPSVVFFMIIQKKIATGLAQGSIK
ncbi:MAG: carbohydrate ABC transporter permease [Sphaerochaeta associata]|uniref:carbohydrate ABC transporter permease n=1 Tax=Sphaerochaeta associata TaxID=1129264 RepID=UPI002B208A16|nr:carbohydrate ABC transporter permease [Sphaerochaeta associata]MEA5107927.1 carbohydrate ABC transporter permease [Sphaerochaeta associata]